MRAGRALISAVLPEHGQDKVWKRMSDHIGFLLHDGWTVSLVSQQSNSHPGCVRSLQQRGVAVFLGDSWFKELISTREYALAILGSWSLGETQLQMIRECAPETVVVIEAIEVEFLENARNIFSTATGARHQRSLDTNYAGNMMREMNAYAAADAVLVRSTRDADLINGFAACPSLAHPISDAVDMPKSPFSFAEREGVLFAGCFNDNASLEAVNYISREVVPRIDPALLAKHPIRIVGVGLERVPAGVADSSPHLKLVGPVPSPVPYYQRARISLVPALAQSENAEALVASLLSHTPVVTTTIGASKLCPTIAEHVLIADDPQCFANSISRLLSDAELWMQTAQDGHDAAEKIHATEVVRKNFIATLNTVLSKRRKVGPAQKSEEKSKPRRVMPAEYVQLRSRIRELTRGLFPQSATIVVASKGDEELLKLGGRQAWHFPRLPDGRYAGHHPADSAAAITELNRLRECGADYLLIPSVAFWWLEHYREFAEHVATHYSEIFFEETTCRVYKVIDRATPERSSSADVAVVENSHARPAEKRLTDFPVRSAEGALPLARLIAFYLPQFHPIPENDAWWGEGFTEWRNVSKATPLFPDHYQPRLPAELGFYDLRNAEVRERQAALARDYGIHGFCYYHYWFAGKRLLERPFGEVLLSGQPDFPFCLCWANEPWTRKWDGMPANILQPQHYSAADDVAHIRALIPALKDPRAITVEGKPLLLIYRARDLPNIACTVETWRRETGAAGIQGLFLVAVETAWDLGWDATKAGFDARVLFQPHFPSLAATPRLHIEGKEDLKVYDYAKVWPVLANPTPVGYRRYDTVFPSWDNAARVGEKATVIHNSTPAEYEAWLRQAIDRAQSQPAEHRLVFINAWNEWGEGAQLEPDVRHGRGYLEATKRALTPPTVMREVAGPSAERNQSSDVFSANRDGGEQRSLISHGDCSHMSGGEPATTAILQAAAGSASSESAIRPITAATMPYNPSPRIPLFDTNWYLEKNPDVRAAGCDAYEHYLNAGAAEGRDPHPVFDTNWYLQQNPDVAKSGTNPLQHYFSRGAREGRRPHPMFDVKFYWKTYPEAILSGQDALQHYLSAGWKKGYKPNPKFDPAFYLTTYPDIAAAGVEPLTHFIASGLKEGRIGSPEDLSFEEWQTSFEISRDEPEHVPLVEPSVKAIAFYLPQFHPIPENDAWWGKGFTEWTNVRRGTGMFPGHYQPHVPAHLGYYDLRDPSVMEKQARLARANGIHGFCYYYYWFAGKTLLDLPIDRLLTADQPDFPFCLCWANENWTRRWDGMESEILIAQKHSPEDDLAFIKKIEPVLLHRNYIRVQNKPLLMVYRPSLLPDAAATTKRWRDYFRERGHGELHLAMTLTFHDATPPEAYGFDAAIQFPPQIQTTPVTALLNDRLPDYKGTIYDYNKTKTRFLEELNRGRSHTLYPGVMPSWDNTARRRHQSGIWINSSPDSYHDWLSKAVRFLDDKPQPERLVFINAWNEWAEGCHLEPDEKFGYAWLNATRLAIHSEEPPAKSIRKKPKRHRNAQEPMSVLFVSHDAHPHGAQYCLLTLATWLKENKLVSPRFLLAGPGSLTEEFSRLGPVFHLDPSRPQTEEENKRVTLLLKSFAGPDLAAVYVNSAAAGHVCALTESLSVPHVAHVHELEESIQRWVGADKMQALREAATVCIAASEPVAKNLRINHGFPKQKLKVVHEFIRCSRIGLPTHEEKRNCRKAVGLNPDARVILGCGTTDRRKAPDLFVQVAQQVLSLHSERLQFIWVGVETRAGEIRELEQTVAEMGLSDSIQFSGAVATPLPYMLASDIFLLPSREDPFPLVCLEAADCGLPIVCFEKAGGMPHFVGSDCGAVVPYLDVGKMAREVISLLTDQTKIQSCANNARLKVRAEFDVSVKGQLIHKILKNVCRRVELIAEPV